MFKAMSAALVLTFSVSSFSNVKLNSFKDRFSFVRNDQGEVSYVRMKLVNKKWSILPYVNQVKNDVKAEIQRMRTKTYQNEFENFISELENGAEKSQEVKENILVIRESFENMKGLNIDKFFNEAKTKGVLAKFEKELKDALMLLDLSVIASTEDPRYFYKRNVTYEVLKRAIEFAKKQFDNIPVLNLVAFIMVEVHEMVLEQRLFHQNMMLHYLENVKETEIGLTVKEADRIFSSIYESRIAATNIFESNRAAETWARYGLNKFYVMVRTANNRLRRSSGTLDEVGSRYNFGFFEAKEDGERVVKNLIHNQHMFSNKMATAYSYDNPDEVRRFRSLLNLGQLGLGFLPIPGFIKAQVENFIQSFYVEQKRLEGALVAYFEINGNKVMAKNIHKQLVNPYIMEK